MIHIYIYDMCIYIHMIYIYLYIYIYIYVYIYMDNKEWSPESLHENDRLCGNFLMDAISFSI